MRKFFEAFVYFVENGLDPKLAKEFAEKVTGIKVKDAETLKAFTPEIKKSVDTKPKGLITRKERGDLLFINTKISDPQKSKMVLQGLDGTTENVYSQFRIELEAYKNGLERDLKFLKDNNKQLSGKDLDNVRYNMKIIDSLETKVNQLADDLIKVDKEPEKIYQNFRNVEVEKRYNISKKEIEERIKKDQGILQSMDTSMEKIKKLLDEMEDNLNPFQSGAKAKRDKIDNETRVRNLYQGKGYGPDEALFRSLSRQFLRDEIEAGRIVVTPRIYDAMKKGNHPFIDPIKVFRHHYGDDAFDKLGKFIDENAFSDSGIRYPGRFEFRKMGLVVKNKNAPGKTYEHYSLPGEIDQQIADVDKVIKTIEEGNNPFFKTKEDIKNQNSKRANLVKIKNEIAPEDTKVQPGDELLETAEVVPIKQEGIISDVDLNIDRGPKTLKGVELYGDETFDELKYIDENGVHPRDLDPREGFAKGGIISLT